MDKENIIIKLDSVCQALNNLTITGIQNMATLAGCFTVLQEIKQDIMSDNAMKAELDE